VPQQAASVCKPVLIEPRCIDQSEDEFIDEVCVHVHASPAGDKRVVFQALEISSYAIKSPTGAPDIF